MTREGGFADAKATYLLLRSGIQAGTSGDAPGAWVRSRVSGWRPTVLLGRNKWNEPSVLSGGETCMAAWPFLAEGFSDAESVRLTPRPDPLVLELGHALDAYFAGDAPDANAQSRLEDVYGRWSSAEWVGLELPSDAVPFPFTESVGGAGAEMDL